jgi:MoaA/NifB/PqqE/SkfB family radical SAM enzyme
MENKEITNNYTSTGIKFWKHPYQMNNYKKDNPNTIISTHISPTSKCNLSCEYCSVKLRKPNHIELDVIKDYIEKLSTRGLEAVIITGGGEPTFYKQFNELVHWLKYDQCLSVALITNGTNSKAVDDWDAFTWVRVSVNFFDGWKEKISLPLNKINKEKTTIGMSFIDGARELEDRIEDLALLRGKLDAKYIRILPDCLLPTEALEREHKRIADIFDKYTLPLYGFFHQYKNHHAQKIATCHQAYFRPYLSEVDGGTVYPCDSIVLNDQNRFFHDKYRICKAEDILEFLDKKIQMHFTPYEDCEGCVFHNNIRMLEDFKYFGLDKFDEVKDKNIVHEEFV